MLLIFLLTFGAGWFSTAQQRQFFIDEARRYFENLILFGREAEWFRLTHPPKIQTQTTVAYDSQSLASPPPPPSTQRWDGPIARSPAPTGRDETANIDKDARVHPPGKRPIELTKQNSLTIKRVPSARLPGNAPDRKRQLEFAIGKAIQDRAINGIEVSVSDDTVYLDGRVATPQQVLSAVRATLTVPGVKHIRNRVVVSG